MAGTTERVRRVLDRLAQGGLTRSLPPWAAETLATQGAQFAIAGDFATQPIASATLGSINLSWLKGLQAVRAIGNFDDPGVNVAATLTYGDPTAAQGATDGIHLIDSWQKLLAPLLLGAKVENLQVGNTRQRRVVQVCDRRLLASRSSDARVPVRQATVSMTTLVVHPADRPLAGSVPVASDESIAHRALLLGRPRARQHAPLGLRARRATTPATASCLRALGVAIGEPSSAELTIAGGGLDGLRQPAGALDCGASATTMELLCGVLARRPVPCDALGRRARSRDVR